MTIKRFVTWRAVSSRPQVEKISLENQESLGREAVELHGGELIAELVIPGFTRNIVLFEDACRDYPDAYGKLKELIDQRAFDVLVFLNPSRLGRTVSLIMAIIESCWRAEIVVYDLESPPRDLEFSPATHSDIIIAVIKSAAAQNEIIEMRRRNTTGMLDLVRRGELPSGLSFGYVQRFEPDGRRVIEVDDQSANLVIQMYEWYLSGSGSVAIKDKLNEIGATSPTGKRWTSTMVRSILFRAWRYAGYGEINRRSKGRPYLRAKGNWPAIITDEIAERVFAERDNRRNNRQLSETGYLLSGLVWCVHCNKTMVVSSSERQRPTRHRQVQLRCPYGVEHEHAQISYRRVLTWLRDAISELAEVDPSDVNIGEDDRIDILQSRIAGHAAAIARLRGNLKRADDAYVRGLMDIDRYQSQLDQINQQIAHEANEIERLQSETITEKARGTRRDRIKSVADHGLEMLDSENVAAANAWFRERLRVWVDAHKVVFLEWT